MGTNEEREWSADALAADGAIVRLRPVAATDTDGLTELYRKGSADSLRLRFFGSPGEHVIDGEVARLVRPLADDHDAIVAEENGRIIGVASYERRPADSPTAEFAVFVDDEHHGRGVGTLLLEHLAGMARRVGVTELAGEVMPTNVDMLKVARDLGEATSAIFDAGVVDVRFHTMPDASALALAQTDLTRAALQHAWPELEVTVQTFVTRGDQKLDLSLIQQSEQGGKGLFTKELEEALLAPDGGAASSESRSAYTAPGMWPSR